MKKQRSEEAEKQKSSQIYNLDPYLDEDGIIRVGRRLDKLNLNNECKHLIVLPRGSPISKLIITWCHKKTGHKGRGMTLNIIRISGFWIVCANSATRKFIHYCVACRSLRGKLGEQKITDLPFDRLQGEPPFTYCRVDWFCYLQQTKGIKMLWSHVQMSLQPCYSYEVAHSLHTDSFLLTLQRFIERRGNIRSDNGSNFVGTVKELQKSFQDMNHRRINKYLQVHGADWITWINNLPTASHMGGVWERQIRKARGILKALVKTHGENLDKKLLNMLLVEVEAIVNSSPMTTEAISDIKSDIPLSAVNLLTMKSKVILPPPGCLSSADIYCRKHWRRV